MPFGTDDEVITSPTITPRPFGQNDEVLSQGDSVPFQNRTAQGQGGDTLSTWHPSIGERLTMAAPGLFDPTVQLGTGKPRGFFPNVGQALGSFAHFAPLSAEQWTGQPPQNVAQGLTEGVAKQVTPANIGIGLMASPLLMAKEATTGINLAKALLAAYFAKQGAEMGGQEAAKVIDPIQTPGQRAEAGVNVALGGAMGVAPLWHGGAEPKFFTPEDVQAHSANLEGVEKRSAYEAPHIFGGQDEVVSPDLVTLPQEGGQGPIYPQYGGNVKLKEEPQPPQEPTPTRSPFYRSPYAIQEREATTLPMGPSPGDSGQMEQGVRGEGLQQPKVGQETQTTPTEGEVIQSGKESEKEKVQNEERLLSEPSKEPPSTTKLYGGFFPLDPDFWRTQIGIAKDVKVDAQQMYNRIRNKLGEESAAWKTLNTPEFQAAFAGGGKMTTDEARGVVERTGPKVEVRKFGGVTTHEGATSEARQAQHWLETRGYEIRDNQGSAELYQNGRVVTDDAMAPEVARQFHTFIEEGFDEKPGQGTHWQSIAPKPESEMPGYVEGAVTVPLNKEGVSRVEKLQQEGMPYSRIGNAAETRGEYFPSYHSFPPNTLGFFRGYMENINGEKTFRVIEAQTDIAQKIEEGVYQVSGHPELGKFSSKTEALNAAEKIHPIVKQWERLTVKAAIDHALSEGATKVVFDDAKTAMMTEGHDRHAFSTHQEDFVSRKNAEIAAKDTQETTGVAQQVIPSTTQEGMWTFRAIPKPVQEPGMTLHYDRILPKLGEELTGSKGEKVEMGEHKMAFVDERAYDRAPSEAEVTGLRKDLIFRNPDGTPKTTSTGMAFDLSKVKGKDWSILQSDKVKAEKPGGIGGGIQRAVEGGHRSEEGAVNLQMVKDAIDAVFTKVGEGIHAIPELFKSDEFRSAVNRFSGVAAPKTTTRMPIVGNQLVMMAKADDISHAVSTDLANQVLGKYVKDEDFRRRLGFVGAEDRFRREGKSMIGTPQAQGITEQQYQQWLHAPDIRAALDRHRQLVQPGALARHQALGGKVAAGGAETDAFFNLIPVEATGQSKAMVGSSKGQLATLKKGSAFGRQFKGSADTYDFDYQHMMDRMVRGNWAEVEKQKLYNLVEGTGFGKIQKSGQARPAGVEDMEGIPIQRKQVVYSKQGKPAKNVVQNETMWVPKASAEEFRQAFQVNSPMKSWLSTFGRAVTEVQVSLGVDAAVHITNQSAALLTRIVKDPKPIKQVQGIVKDIGRALTKDPGFTHELAVLAEKYGIVRSGEADERSLLRKILQPGSGLVHTLDKVSRVALNRMYQDAVDRGVAPDERIWRRAAVHGAIGEYNKALLDHWQQTVKEMGISPFLVAGLNFNRLAIRQAIMSPGIKTTSAVEGAKLRARAAISTAVIAMMLPSIMNYVQTGSILPPGVKVGQGVVHKNKDGTYETIDFAKWLMQRRAFDITGVDALATGIEQGQSAKQIAGKMGGQILRGAVRPYAGPAISAALMATKGEDLLGYRKSKDKSAGEKLKAAGKELNPMTATVLGGSTSDIGGRVEQRLGKTIGVGRSQSPISMVKSMAIDFNEREGQPVEDRPASQYKELSNALRSGDASAVRSSVAELQKKGVANATIKKYYDELPYKNLTGRDAAAESRFVGQLTADQKKVYDQVAAQEFDAQRNFYNIVLQRPAPPRRMPKRQARPKRGVEFPGEGVQEEP